MECLVVDTSALIFGGHFAEKAQIFVTTQEVLDEVKDKKTVSFVENLPFALEVISPDSSSILAVIKASRETGDYGFLSKTDIKLLALAYQLSLERVPDFRGVANESIFHSNQQANKVEATSTTPEPNKDAQRESQDELEEQEEKDELSQLPNIVDKSAVGQAYEQATVFTDDPPPASETVHETFEEKTTEEPKPAKAAVEAASSSAQQPNITSEPSNPYSSSCSLKGAWARGTAGLSWTAPVAQIKPVQKVVAHDPTAEKPHPKASEGSGQVLEPFTHPSPLPGEGESRFLNPSAVTEGIWAKPSDETKEPNVGDDDSDGDWITPENLKDVQQKDQMGLERGQAEVGLLTTDFPMQNVALHLGVYLVNLDGMCIKYLKRWILRCHGCFEIVRDTTRQFCPACGSGDTLKKVSYTVDNEGKTTIWINEKHTISIRNTIHKLPKPRWGMSGTNRTLPLREDQLRGCGRRYNREKEDRKLAKMWDDDWMFAPTRSGKRVTHLAPTTSYFKRHPYGPTHRKK